MVQIACKDGATETYIETCIQGSDFLIATYRREVVTQEYYHNTTTLLDKKGARNLLNELKLFLDLTI